MSDNITITVDRDGLTRGHQISINLVKTDGSGHGYRIAGPKFNGSSTNIIKHTLTKRDAGEIRYYLDRIFPDAELARLREEIEQYREAARGQVVIVNTASSRIKELEAEVVRLREALEPFAKIKPSTAWAEDGSEAEPYHVFLACGDYFDFTGADLAAARRALEAQGGVSEPSAPSEWQKRGPDFNEWEIEWERFATMLADAKGEYFWVCDGALKYLNIRLDTRSNAFILRDRDDNRIDPSRVEAAIRQCRDILGGVVKIDRDGRRELKENIHDKG